MSLKGTLVFSLLLGSWWKHFVPPYGPVMMCYVRQRPKAIQPRDLRTECPESWVRINFLLVKCLQVFHHGDRKVANMLSLPHTNTVYCLTLVIPLMSKFLCLKLCVSQSLPAKIWIILRTWIRIDYWSVFTEMILNDAKRKQWGKKVKMHSRRRLFRFKNLLEFYLDHLGQRWASR
jgi:hypothetical protein